MTKVTQSLPNQVALIHSASRYCAGNNRPDSDCASISETMTGVTL